MTKQLDAIYKGGAFFPLSPPQGIFEGDKVQIRLLNIIRATPEEDDPGALQRAVARMTSRTPEEVEATRARLFAEMESPTPLPPGKTLEDVISGKWPGDETDEEVRLPVFW